MRFAVNTITQSLLITMGLSSVVFAEENTTAEVASVDESMLVFGQQNSYLNPRVTTANKTDIDPLDMPQTVNVINQQFLQDIRATTLDDAYGYTTGFTRSNVDADGFTLRGIPADLNTIQVNVTCSP